MSLERIQLLIDAELDGMNDEAGARELSEWIAEDKANAVEYAKQVLIHSQIREALGSTRPSYPMPTMDSESLTQPKTDGKKNSLSSQAIVAVAATLLLAVGTGLWYLAGMRSSQVDPSLAAEKDLSEKDLLHGAEILNERIVWAYGVIRVRMANESLVHVEGPAEFTVTNDQSVTLHRGRLVGNVPEGVSGLTVVAGEATVTDLGTEFGVSFEPGQPTEVHVFEGAVELKPKAATAARVGAGQGRSVTEDAVRKIEFDETSYIGLRSGSRFAQQIKRDAVGYWRFEELADGNKWLVDQVSGVPDVKGAYAEVNATPGIEGLGGTAAAFDGAMSIITIPHDKRFSNEEISVSFWFRSTQEWKVTVKNVGPNSPALISRATDGVGSGGWAIRGVERGRMRISVTPEGRSATRLHSTTGLNDGRWHYVVWTRDHRGMNHLYVDGQLDDRRRDEGGSVANDRATQIGGDTLHKRSKYFDGAIDEMAIFDTVLTKEQVQQLYDIGANP